MDKFKLNKSAISFGSLHDGGNEQAYWLSKTPLERLEALEYMRQILYGYDPDTVRLERVIEIIERKKS